MESFNSSNSTKDVTIQFKDLNKSIKAEDIEKFLKSKNIEHKDLKMIETNEIFILNDPFLLSEIESLIGLKFPCNEDQIIDVLVLDDSSNNFSDEGLDKQLNYLNHKNLKENEEIKYKIDYAKVLMAQFDRKVGEDGLIFTNKVIIEKQKAVIGFLLKSIGANLLQGKSIMNISLPINMFDYRTLLELVVHEYSHADALLSAAAKSESPVERLKWVISFAISRFHLSSNLLKPFNPILGETFQAKVGDTCYYIEQTSHHPPILNYYIIGPGFKITGHREFDIITGANSIISNPKGPFRIHFDNSDDIVHIHLPKQTISGTMMGSRKVKFKGRIHIVDRKNDLVAEVVIDPDSRGFFKKITSKKETYPDYFHGVITYLSKNAKIGKKEISVKSFDKEIISKIEGEITSQCKIDNETYFTYNPNYFPTIRRQANTLPSDSTLRKDRYAFIENNDDFAQKAKIELENIQRHDRKLRDAYKKQQKKKK